MKFEDMIDFEMKEIETLDEDRWAKYRGDRFSHDIGKIQDKMQQMTDRADQDMMNQINAEFDALDAYVDQAFDFTSTFSGEAWIGLAAKVSLGALAGLAGFGIARLVESDYDKVERLIEQRDKLTKQFKMQKDKQKLKTGEKINKLTDDIKRIGTKLNRQFQRERNDIMKEMPKDEFVKVERFMKDLSMGKGSFSR